MTDPEIHKGLAGVVVDTTTISSVNPQTNSLLYRGYPVQELAASCSFEEVAWLLWHGDLPTREQLAGFEKLERGLRRLDDRTRRALDDIPASAHPMDALRTAVSQLGGLDPTLEQENGILDPELNQGRAVYLLAQLPAIVAYIQRRRRGLDPIEPRDDLDYSRNFLWLTFGEVPDDVVVDAFRVSLILYAEHSFNASTFTARVSASTLSDVYSAVTGAIGALKGPLHGGANEAVMHAFDEIGSADKAEEWLDAALAEKRKIMGFGHRVYKNGDSRVPTMKASLEKLAEHFFETFPQLDGLRFTHRWGGVIDTCTRFTAFHGTAYDCRVAYALGFTGLGVGATRFAAEVALDQLGGEETPRTGLRMVRERPVPFPPEPLAAAGIAATRWSLDRADHNKGKRNLLLKTLDAVGMGFDS